MLLGYSPTDAAKNCALLSGVKAARLEVVQLLLAGRADPLSGSSGNSALDWAERHCGLDAGTHAAYSLVMSVCFLSNRVIVCVSGWLVGCIEALRLLQMDCLIRLCCSSTTNP